MSASWFLVKFDNPAEGSIYGASPVMPGDLLKALNEAKSMLASDKYGVITGGDSDNRVAIFSIHEREMEGK